MILRGNRRCVESESRVKAQNRTFLARAFPTLRGSHSHTHTDVTSVVFSPSASNVRPAAVCSQLVCTFFCVCAVVAFVVGVGVSLIVCRICGAFCALRTELVVGVAFASSHTVYHSTTQHPCRLLLVGNKAQQSSMPNGSAE